jgi:hypothetical protein
LRRPIALASKADGGSSADVRGPRLCQPLGVEVSTVQPAATNAITNAGIDDHRPR